MYNNISKIYNSTGDPIMRNEKFLYREIYQALKNQIESGALAQGDRLP